MARGDEREGSDGASGFGNEQLFPGMGGAGQDNGFACRKSSQDVRELGPWRGRSGVEYVKLDAAGHGNNGGIHPDTGKAGGIALILGGQSRKVGKEQARDGAQSRVAFFTARGKARVEHDHGDAHFFAQAGVVRPEFGFNERYYSRGEAVQRFAYYTAQIYGRIKDADERNI